MNREMIGPLMKKISEEIEWKVNEELKSWNLTRTQAAVILYLDDRENKEATQKEIEEFLNVSHSTTVTILRSMQAKGMLEIQTGAEDRRMRVVRLTWGDTVTYRKLEDRVSRMEERLLRGFSGEERELFKGFCKRAEENMR
jgi:MarR family transcriptional repressor of mepA